MPLDKVGAIEPHVPAVLERPDQITREFDKVEAIEPNLTAVLERPDHITREL